MSCPTCGTAATCPRCAKASSGSWGSAFDSWGSPPGEWGTSASDSLSGWGAGLAVANPPASSWARPPEQPAVDGWSASSASSGASLAPEHHPQLAPEKADSWAEPAVPRSPSRAQEDEPPAEDGWGTPPQPTFSKKAFLPGLPGCDDGFTQETEDSRLQPARQEWGQDEDESWIDETAEEGEIAPAPAPTGSSQKLLWAAVGLTALLVAVGVMFLRSPQTPPPDPAAIKNDQRMEALQSGRRLVIAGKTALTGDKIKNLPSDPEAASLQLEAGIKALKEGSASAREIGRARALLANCWWSSRQWEKAYKTWGELASNPAYKTEAASGKAKAKQKLQALADSHLQNSTGSLRAMQYEQAITQANEALRLLKAYNGAKGKQGTAHGNIAFSELNLGHRSAALTHFNEAWKLSGNSLYLAMAEPLQMAGAGSAVESAPAAASNSPEVLSATAVVDPQYPQGQAVAGKPKKPTPGTPASQPAPTPAKPKVNKPFVFTPKPKPVDPPRESNTFDWTDRSGK